MRVLYNCLASLVRSEILALQILLQLDCMPLLELYVHPWQDSSMGTSTETRPGTGGVTLTEAAQQLGISRDALKKRVQRGALPAYKDESGSWRIVLPEAERPGDSGGDVSRDKGEGPFPGQVSPAVSSQFTAVMDQWLQPLVNQIATQAQEIGELTADLRNERERREQLQHDYETAQKELAGLRMLARVRASKRVIADEPSPDTSSRPSVPETVAETQPRPWWKTLFGGGRG